MGGGVGGGAGGWLGGWRGEWGVGRGMGGGGGCRVCMASRTLAALVLHACVLSCFMKIWTVFLCCLVYLFCHHRVFFFFLGSFANPQNGQDAGRSGPPAYPTLLQALEPSPLPPAPLLPPSPPPPPSPLPIPANKTIALYSPARASNACEGAGTSSVGSGRPPYGGGGIPQDGQSVPDPHRRGRFAGVPGGVADLGGAAFRRGFQRQRRWVDRK